MDVAVTGGTGVLGRAVVAQLVERGHDVRVLSRRRPRIAQPGTTHHAVDLVGGAGLRDALAGADAVVEAANTPGSGRKARPVLVEGTRRLLEVEARAGVAHHVAISIVGIDALPGFSYYAAKLEQERLVERGPVGWSIVRATQFHELLELVFGTTARARLVPANDFPLAPVAPRIVARALADAVEAGPGGRLAEVGGPQAAPLRELSRDWAHARERRVGGLRLPLRRSIGRALAGGALVPGPGAVRDGPSFGDWLRATTTQAVGA